MPQPDANEARMMRGAVWFMRKSIPVPHAVICRPAPPRRTRWTAHGSEKFSYAGKPRRLFRGCPKRQLPMWHAYHVELYPHFTGLIAGRDELRTPLEFPAFFRKRRGTSQPKGIVKIIR